MNSGTESKKAHCLKCKSKQDISEPARKMSKKNIPYTGGKCGSCGTNVRTGNSKREPQATTSLLKKY
jgi:hypothetical protein